jgi:hypothetical protein
MNITLKNFGPIKNATFEPGDLTIICGGNNTGKTYATYALFGFLSFWNNGFAVKVNKDDVQQLMNEGSVELDIRHYIDNAPAILEIACEDYTKELPEVFAASEKSFKSSRFKVDLEKKHIHPKATFERSMGSSITQILTISKYADSTFVNFSLLFGNKKTQFSPNFIGKIIGDALKDIIFDHLFPNPFIASAERTGAAIFKKEIISSRNRLLEEMGSMSGEASPIDVMSKLYADYALPIKSNVEFTRRLEEFSKKDSFITKEHPVILDDFADIIGGEYLVSENDELYFVPTGKRIKLTMDESSSAVRSLLIIGFYLRHVAAPGDMLMIDEPELNLHPENQRRMARLFSRLVNLGIKVFITTHSDYIIKELNTLIMLNHDKPHLKKIAEREGYKQDELLSADKVRVYMAEEEAPLKPDGAKRKIKHHTLVEADIDPELGIEARSFDETIGDMNRVQEEVVWGG